MLRKYFYGLLGLLCLTWQMVAADVITEPLYSFPPQERVVGHTDRVFAVAYSPDGSRIVSGSDDTSLKIWDAKTGVELNTLSKHSDSVNAVAYSPDGSRIVSASGDNTLKIWDANTGIELMTLSGHTDSVNAVAYSPDGNRIISGSYDKTLKIWDANTWA
ncbi:WD40 repeat domain-containing protein, partial [Candidatus Venteria ishoeyi]|uniref:WD40 repeat domain-containing protein n=1 Tax=Candidatus Venteria ishoeyi TaxID=1899563 RepID=UPI0011B09AB2